MLRYSFLLLLFCIACSDDEMLLVPYNGSSFCETEELPVISDGKSCDVDDNPFLCEIIEVEETQYIDQDAYEWSPDICDFALGDEIVFKNGVIPTSWHVVEQGHYIAEERIYVACNENYELATYICQNNEVIYVSFLSDLLGNDTLRLELRTKIISYEDQNPGEKRNIINLWQDRAYTNIANFWIRHFIGDTYYEQTWQSYHPELTLHGNVYKDVIRYEYGEHIHAEPDFRYYMQKGKGILGFEVNDKLWLRD